MMNMRKREAVVAFPEFLQVQLEEGLARKLAAAHGRSDGRSTDRVDSIEHADPPTMIDSARKCLRRCPGGQSQTHRW